MSMTVILVVVEAAAAKRAPFSVPLAEIGRQ